MAEKQSGPVKPPTLDMQARRTSPRTPRKPAEPSKSGPENAGTSAQGSASSTATSAASDTPPPRRPTAAPSRTANASFPVLPAAISALTGAVIAVLLILGLATSGMLSGLMPQAAGDTAERLTFAEEQVSEALVGFNALNRQVTDLQARLDTIASDQNLAEISARQDELETALAGLPADDGTAAADLSAIQTRLDRLDTRIAALQSGASSEEAGAFSGDLADLRASLAALTGQVEAIELNVSELDESLTTTNQGLLSESEVITALQADLAELQSEPILPSSDTQLLRLPLALSGLETALEAARPFAAELQSLLTLVPDLSASGPLTEAAETGLPAPSRIVTDFARAVPAMMAARPTDPDAGMMDNLMARARALLAIRPTGETGTDPVADTLARAEQAVGDRQFSRAATELGSLPEPMQQAASGALADVILMGEAQTLLAGARASVLAASGRPPASDQSAMQEAAE